MGYNALGERINQINADVIGITTMTPVDVMKTIQENLLMTSKEKLLRD